MTNKRHFVTTFYQFSMVDDVSKMKSHIEETAGQLQILGLVILGNEGFNSTCSCESKENLDQFKEKMQTLCYPHKLTFKDSVALTAPFRLFKVKIRKEIVTLNRADLKPEESKNHHLSPSEWNKVLKEENDFVLIDTRNWYEAEMGTFNGAIDPKIKKFTEFTPFVKEQNFPKEKKMLIFCTGGIRCEKGILELQDLGYENVYQLDGGILNYLKEYPNDQFNGECFVFDHRVSVQQDLSPSTRFALCPHCGQPGDLPVTCKRCDSDAKICNKCADEQLKRSTCSKDCYYQLSKHPGQRISKEKKLLSAGKLRA